jgi:DNA-binding IclR family transcriptional regulator
VLLAHSDAAFQEEVLAGPHEAFTDSTPTDPERLRRMLALIRRDGSAHCPGYLHPDATGIAAPVFRRGEAVATLSVVVPNLPRSRQWEPLLRIAAATVTRRLDGTG